LFEEQCRTGQVLDNSTRFSEFVDIWLKDYAEKQLRPTTLSRYKDMLKRINAALGNMKISAIQPHHLLAFYDNLAESGVRADIKYTPCEGFAAVLKSKNLTQQQAADLCGIGITTMRGYCAGKNARADTAQKIAAALDVPLLELFTPQEDKGLSGKTILHHHRLISAILTSAVQWQVIFSNPCDRVKPPKAERKEARYLDEFQTADLLQALNGEPYHYAVMVQLLLFTGMRRGELFGFEWRDVDFFTNCLHIERSSLYVPEKGVFEDSTKTDTSKRVIKLSSTAVQLLKDYREWQKQRQEECGTAWHSTNHLFTSWNGKPMHPDTLSGWFHEFVQRKELPDVSIHSLRHTNATLMIASGVPIKTVSNRLGHANVTTTGNIYTHAIRSADEAAAEALENLLTPSENNKRMRIS
ncbi:MAG: tyrosine-type recombinase/integrase, partial [Oscillospiraceae bacterium]|nr:tyrosine-type recombinase/integrase [Oscillospiraceae bacterium]